MLACVQTELAPTCTPVSLTQHVQDATKGYTVFRAAAKSMAFVKIPFGGGFTNADILYIH